MEVREIMTSSHPCTLARDVKKHQEVKGARLWLGILGLTLAFQFMGHFNITIYTCAKVAFLSQHQTQQHS